MRLQVRGVQWSGGCTFILSMQASIFSCSTAFLAWEMLAVLLLAMPSFIVLLSWGGNMCDITLNTQIVLKDPCCPATHNLENKSHQVVFCVGVGSSQAAGAFKWKGWQDSFATHPLKKQLLEIFQTLHHLPISSLRTSVRACNG